MKDLLQFISEHLLYLMETFRFVDSKATTAFGGNACIVLESENLRIRLIRERLRMFIEFQSSYGDRTRWYTLDIVKEMVLGPSILRSTLDATVAVELQEMLPALDDAFSKSRHQASERALDALEQKRSKRLYGV